MSTGRALEPESEREMVITRLVQAPRRLVWQANGHTFESTIALEEQGGATLVTMRALFPTRAERDLVVERYRADEGGKQTLGRLAAVCEAQAVQA